MSTQHESPHTPINIAPRAPPNAGLSILNGIHNSTGMTRSRGEVSIGRHPILFVSGIITPMAGYRPPFRCSPHPKIGVSDASATAIPKPSALVLGIFRMTDVTPRRDESALALRAIITPD